MDGLGLTDLAGWGAAAFTLLAYSMKTMLPLRVAGIGANLLFILYGFAEGIVPVLLLHALLLPFNLYRLIEILRLTRQAQEARRGHHPLAWLRGLVTSRRYEAGAFIFRKGDPADNLYFLESGMVRLVETGALLPEGELFGEIAFFTEARERTLSARCEGPCRIAALDEKTFMRLYYQNPAFGVHVVRLVARRLIDGMGTRPDAYRPLAAPQDRTAV